MAAKAAQSMSKTYCKDCRFWDETSQGSTTRLREGRCRRHAPQPAQSHVLEGEGTIWPATFEDDWCGECRPADGFQMPMTEEEIDKLL